MFRKPLTLKLTQREKSIEPPNPAGVAAFTDTPSRGEVLNLKRVVRFNRIGLHYDVPDLLVDLEDTDGHRRGMKLEEKIKSAVKMYLADISFGSLRSAINVHVHPDHPSGTAEQGGFVVAEFTLCLPENPSASQ